MNNFVGSSPYLGLDSTGIVLPPDPTVDGRHRYLIRLCGFALAPKQRACIRRIRQMLSIGTEVSVNGTMFPYELLVTDPNWKFVDGNVSWHLRRVQPEKRRSFIPSDEPTFPAPYGMDNGTDSVILTRHLPPSAGGAIGYIAPGAGVPPGQDLGGLGHFSDMRWPWDKASTEQMDVSATGPCSVVMFASVYQTDPEHRPDPPVELESSWIRPEDSFLMRWPEARYWRIGAELTVDIEDCDP